MQVKGEKVGMKEGIENNDGYMEEEKNGNKSPICDNHLIWSLTIPTTTSRMMKAIIRSIICTRGTRSGQRHFTSLYSPNPARTNMYVVSRRKKEHYDQSTNQSINQSINNCQ